MILTLAATILLAALFLYLPARLIGSACEWIVRAIDTDD